MLPTPTRSDHHKHNREHQELAHGNSIRSWTILSLVNRCAVALALLAAASVASADPSAKVELSDDEFRAEVTGFAASTHRRVVAWGTLPLTGTRARERFATLAALDGKELDPDGPVLCGRAACRGAYVIEEAPGKIWLVSYTDQRWGSTLAFHGSDTWPPSDARPAWERLSDLAIEHHQSHDQGVQVVRFALRDHDVVVLEMHDSIRDGDADEVYGADGHCLRRCPTLIERAKRDTLGWYMQPVVVGPVARIADLHEPPPPPDQP